MGVDVKGVKVRIAEDDSHTVTFVLHPAPKNVASMNEGELKKVAGGSGKCDPIKKYCTNTY